jgi:hypothetical protein
MAAKNRIIQRIVNFLSAIFILPNYASADINTVYDAKLAANNLKDSVINSPIYGIIFYFGSTIVVFIVLIIVVFVLIMMLKK